MLRGDCPASMPDELLVTHPLSAVRAMAAEAAAVIRELRFIEFSLSSGLHDMTCRVLRANEESRIG